MKPHHKHSDIKVYFSGQFNHSPHCLFILVGCWPTCSHESSSPLRCNTYSILFIVIVYGVTPLNSGLRRLLRSRPRASIWPAHRRCNSYHWINLLYICKCMYICIYIYIYIWYNLEIYMVLKNGVTQLRALEKLLKKKLKEVEETEA